MHKEMTGSITISDVSDGALIGFQLEDLIHKTNYYDKNDIDNIINYRLDWRKSDAMFLKVVPDNTGTVQFMIPLHSGDEVWIRSFSDSKQAARFLIQ